jgi:putative ABC transport system permease protein
MKKLARIYRRNNRLNLINVLSMAMGIAAAIILIGFVYQEFTYDVKLQNSGRIFRVITQNKENNLEGHVNYGPLADELKNAYPEILDAVRVNFYYGYLALTAGGNMYNERKVIFTDPNFFNLFSFPLVAGDKNNCLVSPNSIVISKTAARKYFGNKNPLGEQIKIGKDKLFTVGGVFKDFPDNSNFQGDFILPLQSISKLTQVWIEPSWEYPSDLNVFLLLRPNLNHEKLSQKISGFLTNHAKINPGILQLQSIKSVHTTKQILWESTFQANKNYLYLLVVVAFVVLALSGANFLLLYIVSASKRAMHNEIRRVCGASKTVIFREHLKEIAFYISVSVITSIMLVMFYNSYLTSLFPFLPVLNNLDFKLLIFLCILILTFAVSISVFPAFTISMEKSMRIFKTQGQLYTGKSKIVNSLVIGQFSLCIALFAITFLLYKQLHFIENHNPGFAREELITIPLNMHIGDGIYNDRVDLFSEELKNLPGVQNITLAFSSPTSIQTSADEFSWEGKPDGKTVYMQWNSVFFDYFETLGLEIIEGRSFNRSFPSDMTNYENGRKTAFILNQKAVEEMGIENPIGKTFTAYGEGPIVGIVENFNFKSLHHNITPMCFAMDPFYYNEIIVRINPQVPNVLGNIESVWRKFVPDYPLEFSFVTDQLGDMYETEKNLTASLNLFSGVAIIIACIGLLAHTMLLLQFRVKEIGIHKVNGAKIWQVMLMLNKDFVKWVAIAFVIATPIAWYAMSRWLQNFAYRTELSWWIFALAGLLALGIALLTVSWQSWRAARRNPVEALRYE